MLLCYHPPSVPAILVHLFLFFFFLSFFFFFFPGSSQASVFTVFESLFVFYSAIWHPGSLLGCTSTVPSFPISSSVVIFILPSTPRHRVTFVLLASLADVFSWPECSPAPVCFSPIPVIDKPFLSQFQQFSCGVTWLHHAKYSFPCMILPLLIPVLSSI